MARSAKHEDNLRRIQDVLDDKHEGNIQSGYTPDNIDHKIGDKWVDSDGIEWEQKDGYRSKVSKFNMGIFSKQCKDCDKPCVKSFDIDTYNRMSRCYNCQVKFEEDLKYEKKNKIGRTGNKWQFWVKLQQLRRWDEIDKEIEQFVMYKFEENKINPFDKKVANSISNANLSMQIKKNS